MGFALTPDGDQVCYFDLKAHNNQLPLLFILLIVGLRLAWHLLEPVGIAGDEAYYWLWGQYPDWGYFSKPPMIGWIYGGLTAVFGQSVFAYKAFATLLGGAGLWFFYRTLALMSGDEGLARWGCVALALLPAHLLISSMLTIDAPLMFCWAGGMYFTARLLVVEKVSAWDYAGLCLMLALGHLSKQMMLLQPLLILIVLMIYQRALLARPGIWLALCWHCCRRLFGTPKTSGLLCSTRHTTLSRGVARCSRVWGDWASFGVRWPGSCRRCSSCFFFQL